MCAPWDTGCIATEATIAVTNTIFGQAAQVVIAAQQWLINLSASWWVLVPSISLYPDRHNSDPNAMPIDAVANLRALILPITAIVAMGGMLWNGLLMVLSRKPAPLVNVLRGLWNTALWSAVGVFGTNLLLAGTDAFAAYVLTSALKSVGEPSLGKRLSALVVPVLGPDGLPVGLVILISGIGMICAFAQALLMLFRDGAVLILAPMTPLAASGSFTNATSGWLRTVVAWLLTLIFYKDFAAITYAVMIWMTGENSSKDPRVLLFGLAMMITALVALPVLLRFFNWTIGGLQSGGGGLGMLATAGAAGMHAASSLRGGGFGVNEHARYLSETFDRGSSPGPGPGPAGPEGRPGPGPGPSPRPGPGAAPSPGFKPPAFTGEAGSGKVATVTSAHGPAGAAGGGAAGAGTSGAMGASAAAGPAAPVVAGAVVVTSTAGQTANGAANAVANATSEATKGR